MKIQFFYDNAGFRFKRSSPIKEVIKKVIIGEGRTPGHLVFVFSNDNALLEINREFLNHDYYTDVIAFMWNDEILNGEIYISVDSVRRNASDYKVRFKQELLRVVIHAVLHFCGYKDKTEEEKKIMREREDYWLNEAK